jgi:hypothetical protein
VKNQAAYLPFYLQFIAEIEKGFLMLDETSRAEVTDFVKTQQHKNGAFTDRAGNPDLYYSLFGAWLSKALNLDEQLTSLRNFILSGKFDSPKGVGQFSVLLLGLMTGVPEYRKTGMIKLVRIFRETKNLSPAYRFFLFMLSFDALYGKNRLIYFFTRIIMRFYKPSEDLPCSFLAALLLAKFITGREINREVSLLQAFFEKGEGFKAFREQPNADLLSTAVALFALKKTGTDLRLLALDCLKLAGENYDNGAFLSGDGDFSCDLEYTFYGLLILGTLS